MPRRTIPLPFAIDLRRSLGALRLGKHDPTISIQPASVAVAMQTPDGDAAQGSAASLRAATRCAS